MASPRDHLSEPLLNQHAYTRGRSTETALEDVVFYLERYRIKDNFIMAASLDCSGAFDNVTFDSSKRALTRHRLPPGITSWYVHLLENRRVTSDLYGSARTISPTMGTPQGGVLSPTIWNLIIDEIITEIHGSGCKIVGYADDLIILANGTHLPTVRDQLQIALNKIIQWGIGTTFLSIPKNLRFSFLLLNTSTPYRTNCPLGGLRLTSLLA